MRNYKVGETIAWEEVDIYSSQAVVYSGVVEYVDFEKQSYYVDSKGTLCSVPFDEACFVEPKEKIMPENLENMNEALKSEYERLSEIARTTNQLEIYKSCKLRLTCIELLLTPLKIADS